MRKQLEKASTQGQKKASSGVIVAKNLRGAALEAKIAEVLGITE